MIATERTILRPIASNDNEKVFAYRSDSEINKFQGWIPKNIEEVNDFISKNPETMNIPDSWFQLVIIENATQELIGDIGLHFIDKENFQCEIGCTIRKDDQGKGIATEVMRAIVNYLFNDLKKHRIVASIDPANINSIKLVERLGFRKEGHFKESLFIDGEWVDDIVYAILNNEWKQTKTNN
mgnify:CR=1 FL=1